MPALLAEIHAEAPDLRLELREEQTDPLQALIARGELDVGVLALPVSGDGFEEHVLFYEPFVLAAPRGHALDRLGPVTAQELEGYQLLLMTEGTAFVITRSRPARKRAPPVGQTSPRPASPL